MQLIEIFLATLAGALAVIGCSGAQPEATCPSAGVTTAAPGSTAAEVARVSPRLVALDGALYVAPVPDFAVLPRSMLLYVKSPQPLPGSDSHPNIGIVKVLESGDLVLLAQDCRQGRR